MAGLLFAPQVRYGQGKSSFHETSRLIPSKALYLLMFFGTTQELAEKHLFRNGTGPQGLKPRLILKGLRHG
jgi:hypothetical protein